MARKPPLTIVNPATVSIQPPFILGKHGRSLWDRIQADYDVSDSAPELNFWRKPAPPPIWPNS
jgi:hypothetical protein